MAIMDILAPGSKSVFGTKPKAPELEELDLSEEQLKAIRANLEAAPEAAKLSELTADEIDRLIKRTTPNFDAINRGVSENIENWIYGKIPDDVMRQTMRGSAAQALTGGYGGTGMQAALTARDLGLTSLQLMQQGQSAAESWLGASQRLYAPAIATYTNMFITPMQQAAFSVEERNAQFQRSWMKNQIKAMPDPVARGIFDTVMSLASAYLGGSYGGTFNPTQSAASVGQGAQLGGLGTPGGVSYGMGGAAYGGQQGYSFGQPITAPPMSYEAMSLGGAESAPAGAGIGAPITSPGMSLGGGGFGGYF